MCHNLFFSFGVLHISLVELFNSKVLFTLNFIKLQTIVGGANQHYWVSLVQIKETS